MSAKELFLRFGKCVLTPVKRHTRFYVWVLLMSYAIGIIGNSLGASSGAFLTYLLNIFDAYACCVVACVLMSLTRRWTTVKQIVKWAVYTILGVLLTIELFVVFFYHSLVSVHVTQIVMETNASESKEFLSAAVGTPSFWLPFVVVTVVAVISAAIVRLIRSIPKGKAKSVITFIAFALIVWSASRQIPGYTRLMGCYTATNATECSKICDHLHLNTPISRYLFSIAFNRVSSKEISILERNVAATQVDSCTYRCPLIVLVIGESYIKNHGHIYNNKTLPTTPGLEALQKQGDLVTYSDVVTPYNLTTHVFKSLFSMFDKDGEEGKASGDDWTNHTLFTALFKRAGYDVYFLTNQFVVDSNDSWNAMGGTFLNAPALSDRQFTWRNNESYQYDGELINHIPELSKLTSKPTLLIVHLIGQHVEYNERCPKEYAKFTKKDITDGCGGETGKTMRADYANATLYNDHVVTSIFNRFKETDAIGIYFSDHGEEVYDWRDSYERTQERPIPKEAMKYQYEIPMMFYMTPMFRELHPDVAETVRKGRNLPVILHNMSHTLVALGGISTSEYKPELDVLSEKYDSHRQRIIWDEIIYQK